jgi:hypothetical protein
MKTCLMCLINFNVLIHLKILTSLFQTNRIGGVMVSVLASSAVDRGFEPRSVKSKTIILVFIASSLSTQQ